MGTIVLRELSDDREAGGVTNDAVRTAAALHDAAKRRAWAGTATAYAETFAGLCEHAIPDLLDAAHARAGDRLLDVGTGPGSVALAATALDCAVTGVDPDPEMIALARDAAPGARFLVGALPDLPDSVGAGYDVIAANFVLNHVGDPRAAAAALAGMARPGGRVSVSVWPLPPGDAQQLWADVLAAAGVSPVTAPIPACRDFRRTPEGLRELLAGAGLDAIQANEISFTHTADPDLWWSAVERGVAGIGAAYRSQSEDVRRAMREAFVELSAALTGPGGRLDLPARAIVAAGRRPGGE